MCACYVQIQSNSAVVVTFHIIQRFLQESGCFVYYFHYTKTILAHIASYLAKMCVLWHVH